MGVERGTPHRLVAKMTRSLTVRRILVCYYILKFVIEGCDAVFSIEKDLICQRPIDGLVFDSCNGRYMNSLGPK